MGDSEELTCDICGKRISKLVSERLNGVCMACSEEHIEEGSSEDSFLNSYDKMRKKPMRNEDGEF